MTYIHAKERCRELGSTMVEMKSEHQWKEVNHINRITPRNIITLTTFIYTILFQIIGWVDSKYYWVGLTDETKEGTWTWESGIPLANNRENEHWMKGEPNGGGSENCADWTNGTDSTNRGLNDSPCGRRHQVVCERGRQYHYHRNAVKTTKGTLVHNYRDIH